MKERIEKGLIYGSHVEVVHGIPLMFSHAGYRSEMIRYIYNDSTREYHKDHIDAFFLAKYVNDKLNIAMKDEKCQVSNSNPFTHFVCLGSTFNHPIFQAGHDRGDDRNIGGMFWTGFILHFYII